MSDFTSEDGEEIVEGLREIYGISLSGESFESLLRGQSH